MQFEHPNVKMKVEIKIYTKKHMHFSLHSNFEFKCKLQIKENKTKRSEIIKKLF